MCAFPNNDSYRPEGAPALKKRRLVEFLNDKAYLEMSKLQAAMDSLVPHPNRLVNLPYDYKFDLASEAGKAIAKYYKAGILAGKAATTKVPDLNEGAYPPEHSSLAKRRHVVSPYAIF